MNTIVIGTINHSYWSYVHQLNAIERGPHFVDIPLQPVLRMPCRPEVVPELKEMAEDASKGARSFFVVTRREISTTDVFCKKL
jgi:hypothetical protein